MRKMRKEIVAGNWKMNKTFSEGIELVNEIILQIREPRDENKKIVFCPPFIFLQKCVELIKENISTNPMPNGLFSVGAQNCSSESKGAYTGEISAEMIKSVGAEYVIIGHSERRKYFKEEDSLLLKKICQALQNDLIPIFCCGELLSEREAGRHFDVVTAQLTNTLFQLSADDFAKVVIAYEPVWAIGTGVNATPQQAQEMHHFIRNLIANVYGQYIANNTTILYGGSLTPENAKEIFHGDDVDGGLVGGASLKAKDFVKIYESL